MTATGLVRSLIGGIVGQVCDCTVAAGVLSAVATGVSYQPPPQPTPDRWLTKSHGQRPVIGWKGGGLEDGPKSTKRVSATNLASGRRPLMESGPLHRLSRQPTTGCRSLHRLGRRPAPCFQRDLYHSGIWQEITDRDQTPLEVWQETGDGKPDLTRGRAKDR